MPTATSFAADREAPWRQAANPFATRFIRPGALTFQFFGDTETMVTDLAQRFIDHPDGALAITGPHGSGKSTLLCSLQQQWLGCQFNQVRKITLHQGESAPPILRWANRLPHHSLLIVDGFEQLNPWTGCALIAVCRWRHQRLLVTTHQPRWPLTTLHETTPSIDTAKRLTRQLLAQHPQLHQPASDWIDRHWHRFDANLRELWFAMYDWYHDLPA